MGGLRQGSAQGRGDASHLARFEASGRTEGVLFVGRAQEKTALFRTEKRRNAQGKTYPWIVKTTGFVNRMHMITLATSEGQVAQRSATTSP